MMTKQQSGNAFIVALMASIVILVLAFSGACQTSQTPEEVAAEMAGLSAKLTYISETDCQIEVYLSPQMVKGGFTAANLLKSLGLSPTWPIQERDYNQVMFRHIDLSGHPEEWEALKAYMDSKLTDRRFYILDRYAEDYPETNVRVFIGGLYQGRIIALTACGTET